MKTGSNFEKFVQLNKPEQEEQEHEQQQYITDEVVEDDEVEIDNEIKRLFSSFNTRIQKDILNYLCDQIKKEEEKKAENVQQVINNV